MISTGIAVRIRIGPLPYAVAAASAARDSPTVAAGADEAMPMTVSWATPMAFGSRRAAGWGGIPTIAAAGWSVIRLPLVLARRGPRRSAPAPKRSPPRARPPRDHNDHFRHDAICPGSNMQEFPGGWRSA